MPSLEKIKAARRAKEARLQHDMEQLKKVEAAERKECLRLEQERLKRIGRAWKKVGLLETNLDTDPEALQEALGMLKDLATRRDVVEHAEHGGIEAQVEALMRGE